MSEQNEAQLLGRSNEGGDVVGGNTVDVVEDDGRGEAVVREVATDREEDLGPTSSRQENFPERPATGAIHSGGQLARDGTRQCGAWNVRDIVIGKPIGCMQSRLRHPGRFASTGEADNEPHVMPAAERRLLLLGPIS